MYFAFFVLKKKILNSKIIYSFTRFLGKDEPVAPSLHIKPKDPKQFVTPAPGAYNPDGADKDVKEAAPKYSFGIKTKVKIKYLCFVV